jgi:hypothetical protein
MPKLTFYRQRRRDGGTRTGVDVDGAAVLQQFEAGKKPSDPVLLWFVDIRCEGPSLPATPEGARDWLLAQAETVTTALERLADDIGPGLDVNVWPLRYPVPGTRKGVRLAVVCSATRRLAGREMATVLKDLADNWAKYVRGLKAAEPAPAAQFS